MKEFEIATDDTNHVKIKQGKQLLSKDRFFHSGVYHTKGKEITISPTETAKSLCNKLYTMNLLQSADLRTLIVAEFEDEIVIYNKLTDYEYPGFLNRLVELSK